LHTQHLDGPAADSLDAEDEELTPSFPTFPVPFTRVADGAQVAPTLLVPDEMPVPPPPGPPPRFVAGYEILGELGHGGMGVVYKARQMALNRLVALKMIRSSCVGRAEQERFRAEAAAVARLQHPNIVQVYEVGEYEGQPFFSLELLEGGSLDHQLDGRPLAPLPAARLVRCLALAMQAAHDKGIVHRDLKPANILLTSKMVLTDAGDSADSEDLGLPKITDFGLAKYLHDTPMAGHTRTGAVLGTPSYMAPEQAEGHPEEVGTWTDVYALGAILYELLTGRPPFKARTVLETLEQVRSDDPVPPRRLQPKTPRDLETICLKCLHKDPARRYPRAAGLAEDLRCFLAGESIHARPAGAVERVIKWGRRRPAAAALVALCGLVVIAVSTFTHWHIKQLEEAVKREHKEVTDLHRERERTNLLAECQGILRKGEEELARAGDERWRVALAHFTQVCDRISQDQARDDEDLHRLRQEAEQLRDRANERLNKSAARQDAQRRLHDFLDLKEKAFFRLHRDLVAGQADADPEESIRLARQALDQFGLGGGARTPQPDPKLLSDDKQRQLQDGLQEVALTLAEATARPRRGEGPADAQRRAGEALDLLKEAAPWARADTPAFHRHRARYHERRGEKEQAAQERDAAQKAKPTTALDWYLAGQEDLIHHGDAVAAVTAFGHALDQDPELVWALFLRALAYQKQPNFSGARLDLAACFRKRPDFVWARLLHGYLCGQAGDAKTAEDDFNHAERDGLLRDNAERYLLCVYRGTLALERKKLRLAMEQLEKAIALQPSPYHAHTLLAEVCRQLADLPGVGLVSDALRRGFSARAGRHLDQAIRLQPERAEAYRQRAEGWRRSDKPWKALHDLDEAIRVGSHHEIPDTRALAADHRLRAEVLAEVRLYPQALRASQEAVRLDANNPENHRVHAEMLLQVGCAEDALAALDECVRLNPQAGLRVFWLRAQARVRLGDLEGAPLEYTRALAVHADAKTYVQRGWAWLLTGALPQARADFEEALRRDPHLADAYNGRGLVRASQGEYLQGVADAKEALRCGPPSEWLLYNAARVYAQAAAAVSRDPHLAPGQLQLRQEYEASAVKLLDAALSWLPRARQSEFWRNQVLRDLALEPLKFNRAFGRLAAQYNPQGP
jgi:tetratricopeptide (TPR) repeat protein/tRNA A-37 threonylcarbamoyl transferase component Bud32